MKTADSIQNDTDWTKFVAESGSSLERTEELRTRFIQHIQADAIRWAEQLLIEHPVRLKSGHLSEIANQLDPIPTPHQNVISEPSKS